MKKLAIPAIYLGLIILIAPAAVRVPNHMLDLYPDLPIITSDGLQVKLTFPDRQYTLVRPIVPALDMTQFTSRLYVDNLAKETGDGSIERPLKTVQEAIDAARPGTAIVLRSGTYEGPFRITKSGEPGRPIGLIAFPGEVVRLVLKNGVPMMNPHAGILTITSKYVIVYGLLLEGARGRPDEPVNETFSNCGLIFTNGGGEGSWIANNIIYRNIHCGLKELGHGGTKFTFEGNIIFENGQSERDHGIYLPADDAVIRGNVIFKNTGAGIHLYSNPARDIVEYNICFDNGSWGIIVAGPDNIIRNNVLTRNYSGIGLFRKFAVNNQIDNNIVYMNQHNLSYDNGDGTAKYGDPKNNHFADNIFFPDLGMWGSGDKSNWSEEPLTVDPLFVDPAANDFRLQPKSPAKGSARLSAGRIRGSIGAF